MADSFGGHAVLDLLSETSVEASLVLNISLRSAWMILIHLKDIQIGFSNSPLLVLQLQSFQDP